MRLRRNYYTGMRLRDNRSVTKLFLHCHGTAVPRVPTPRSVDHSHSIVPGGLLVMSSTTRFTPLTSLVIRVLMRSRSS